MIDYSTNNIAVLIIFFNKIDETITCINSFLPSKIKIYVLNNGSDKKNWEILKYRYRNDSNFIFIHSNDNLGPSVGRNKLIEASKEEWLFFVDNDITIEPEDTWLESFNTFLTTNLSAKIICPRLFNVHENEFAHHPKFLKKNNEIFVSNNDEAFTNYFPSGASIIHRTIFLTHGLFDEKLFGFEDYEYAIRLLVHSQQPLQVFNLSTVTLRHDHKFQVAKVDKGAVKARYDKEKLTNSFNWIEQKHQIKFDHNWQWWSNRQVENMVGKTFFVKVKNFLKKIIVE